MAYLIRPSFPLVLLTLVFFSIYYIKSLKLKKTFNIVLVMTSVFSLIFFSNKILLEKKGPNSPKEFGNIYDSWFATQELGRFYIEGKYNKLPPLLWTRIIELNPELNKLEGSQAVDFKKKIFYESLLKNPENFIVGSMLQIIKFFEVSQFFKEQFHNTAGFLHIEFYGYRVLLILLFLFAAILSTYKYIACKKLKFFFSGLVFFSVILSQPFIYGGEARTAAPIILFLNYIIVKLIFDIIQFLKPKISLLKNNQLESFKFSDGKVYLITSIFPFITLFFFFISALSNNYNFTENNSQLDISCPEGYEPKQIIFHSNSGFFINSAKKKLLPNEKDFNSYYNYIIDLAVIFIKYGAEGKVGNLSNIDILSRDNFKLLTPFLTIIDTRHIVYTDRQKSIFKILGSQYLSDGGFFINPVNISSGKLEGLVILKENMVKRGFNLLNTCL